MTPLLDQRERERSLAREAERSEARQRLRQTLHEHLANHAVWVFGSLLRPGHFHARSDIDIAVETLPPDLSIYSLASRLQEAMNRPVDVIWLPTSRLRDHIIEQGERWTG